jgi:hypothetical protein
MPTVDETMRTYSELAENYDRQGQAQMRDRFLVLAADAALSAGRSEEADRIRHRLLQANPHHLLKPYASFGEAMRSADVQNYVSALRRSHPYEKAEHLLEEMRQNPGAAKAGPSRPMSGTGSREMERPGHKAAAEHADELKVFRIQDEEEETKTVPSRVRPIPPVQPAPAARTTVPSSRPVPGPQPARNVRPATMPDVFPLHREAELPAPLPSRHLGGEEMDSGGGAWIAAGLCWLVLVVGIGLAGYALSRPFLPPGWLH